MVTPTRSRGRLIGFGLLLTESLCTGGSQIIYVSMLTEKKFNDQFISSDIIIISLLLVLPINIIVAFDYTKCIIARIFTLYFPESSGELNTHTCYTH